MTMIAQLHGRRGRRGMTLVELLVVISVIMVLAMLAVPAMRPALDARRNREAARGLNVFLGAAQVRAIDQGRPVGVQIQRDPQLPQAGTILYQVEVPPPYSGETINAVAAIQDWTLRADRTTSYWGDGSTILKMMFRAGDCAYPRVQVGDLVQLGGMGAYYRIVVDPLHDPSKSGSSFPYDYPVDSSGFINLGSPPSQITMTDPQPHYIVNYLLTLRLEPAYSTPTAYAYQPDGNDGTNPATYDASNQAGYLQQSAAPFRPYWTQGVTFRFIRQPARTSAPPMRIDSRLAIDLAFSGTDRYSFESRLVFPAPPVPPLEDVSPVTIMFAPTGEVTEFWHNKTRYQYRDPIYLLIGQRSRVPTEVVAWTATPPYNASTYASPAEDQLPNWRDLQNFWIRINPQTGLVTTSEVFQITGTDWRESRTYAREGQTMGGR